MALAQLAQRGAVRTAHTDPVVRRHFKEVDSIGRHRQQFIDQAAA